MTKPIEVITSVQRRPGYRQHRGPAENRVNARIFPKQVFFRGKSERRRVSARSTELMQQRLPHPQRQ